MQKYSNNSLMSKFIKNLLYRTYIPTCNTVNQGDFIIEGFDYVYETNLIKCTKTGYLGGRYKQDLTYGTIYGKNRLFNQYLSLTTQQPFISLYADESEMDPSDLPFAVLNITNRTLTINYSVYTFTGEEVYSEGSSSNQLILTHPGSSVKSNYTGLDDYKCYCNVFTKSSSSEDLLFTTITLFENDNKVYINKYLDIAGVNNVEDFKAWTVKENLAYSYPLATPLVINNLTDEQLNLLFDGLSETTKIIAYHIPNYGMVHVFNSLFKLNLIAVKQSNVQRNINTTTNGITYTLRPDGTVLINGTATEDSYYTLNQNFNSTEFYGFLYSGFLPYWSGIEVRITDNNYSVIYQTITENNIPIENNGLGLSFSICVPQGITINNYVMSPMLRLPTESTTDYETYIEPYEGIISSDESIVDIGRYNVIRSYEWGKLYNKYTQNYISNTNYYDFDLHNYLGKYLRAYRDVKGVDLMPYFNLYTDDYIANFRITNEGVEEYYNNTFKILKVPVRFNKTYTIAIDCPSQVFISPAFFVGNIPLVIRSTSGNSDADAVMTDRLLEYGDYVTSYTSLKFTSPITYRIDNTATTSKFGKIDCAYFQQYERDLCLLIQLPINNNSSIVILEGDYTDTHSTKIVNNPDVWQLHDVELNEIFCSNLSLLQFSTKENYVYSDRLIEYLLWNVINSHDKIDGNFLYVQQLAPNFTPKNFTDGIWNNYMRSKVYDFSTRNNKSTKLDLNGFVDKDTEKLLINQMFS